METDNGPARPDPGRSYGTPCHRAYPGTALVLLQDGSLQKSGGFGPILPSAGGCQWFAWLLSLPVMPREHPSSGPGSLGIGCGGRGEEPKDRALPCLFLRELLILED